MQPAFRKGNGPLPQEIYDDGAGSSGDVWAPLRKGGPNGFVSILTLLVWWGQCCVAQTRWEESTESLWKAVILDVTKSLEMIASKAGQKRRRDHDGATPSSKRYVFFEPYISLIHMSIGQRLPRIDVPSSFFVILIHHFLLYWCLMSMLYDSCRFSWPNSLVFC
jgi:hypothetical protein